MKGIVSFYEKPGCEGNAEQKKKLEAAGYKLQVIDMISKEWETEQLQKFFGGMNIHDCVNKRAPSIKSGALDPSTLAEEDLLSAMVQEPILIKRPLLFFRGEFGVGFENDLVTKLLGEKQSESVCAHHKE